MIKFHFCHNITVSSESYWFVTHSHRVSEDLHCSVVVSCSNHIFFLVELNSVYEGGIHSCWENSFNEPAELSCLRVPDRIKCVCRAIDVVIAGIRLKIMELIAKAYRSDKLAIH
jgi:hypothetical protein